MALTRKQRKLRAQIEEIASIICLDHWNIEAYEADARTIFLDGMKDKLVRAEVISKYTLIDEYLTGIICNYYFRRSNDKSTNYRKLWKRRDFRIFVHYLMDETYLLKKVSVVRAIRAVPKEVVSAISRINDVRNDLAHGFFPQNRRRYVGKKKVIYNGVDLFTPEGISKFGDDFHLASNYLSKRAFGFVVSYEI
jgi:hypothetical protein